MPEPFNEQDRQQLLATRQRGLGEFDRLMDEAESKPLWSQEEKKASEQARIHLRTFEKAENEYFQRLPRIAISRCPLCDKPLVRTFDRFGFDGPWWRSDASPVELPTCPHFCFLKGAVNFNGRKPKGGDFEAHTGPELPYVIPQVLSKPGMTAVMSQMDMTPGYIAYVVAYFAERRPAAAELASNWPKTFYTYTTGLGAHRWQFENHQWDFELAPWLEKKKMRWCPPGDFSTLLEGPASACPYLKIKGSRDPLIVQGDQLRPEKIEQR